MAPERLETRTCSAVLGVVLASAADLMSRRGEGARGVRRRLLQLLILGGLTVIGWLLLGGAGQADAESAQPKPQASAAALTTKALPLPIARDGHVRKIKPLPQNGEAEAAVVDVSRALTSLSPRTIRTLPAQLEQAVSGVTGAVILPEGETSSRTPRLSRPKTNVDAGTADAMVTTAARSGASESSGHDRQDRQANTDQLSPTPDPWVPCPASCQQSVLTIGGPGFSAKQQGDRSSLPRPVSEPSLARTRAIPPAVHTAVDEPSLSPD